MQSQLNMPIFFYDENGYKIGPIAKKELYALVENGTITPKTRLTDGKIETQAKNIPRLNFREPELVKAEKLFDFDKVMFEVPTNEIRIANIVPKNKIVEHHETAIKEEKKYWYLHFVAKHYYKIATWVVYIGLSFTAILSLLLLIISIQLHALFLLLLPLVFLLGFLTTMSWSVTIGWIADKAQWYIDIESHLRK